MRVFLSRPIASLPSLSFKRGDDDWNQTPYIKIKKQINCHFSTAYIMQLPNTPHGMLLKLCTQ